MSSAMDRARYTLWAPGYDLVMQPFREPRRRSIALLDLKPGERVLIVGAGTGEDLPLLPRTVAVVAGDITPAMLARARRKATPGQTLQVMDGQRLEFPAGSFDAAILHLILAVIPDPSRCLAEVVRVLRPGGRIAILDKFVRDGARPSLVRRIANLVTQPLATSVTRRLGDIIAGSGAALTTAHDETALRGLFRIVSLRCPSP